MKRVMNKVLAVITKRVPVVNEIEDMQTAPTALYNNEAIGARSESEDRRSFSSINNAPTKQHRYSSALSDSILYR